MNKLFSNKNLVTFAILLLATEFSILYQRYYFEQSDLAFFIPYVKKLAHPNLYPNDLLIETIITLFPGYLWKVIAVFHGFVNIEILMIALHIFFRFLFFLAIYLLAKLISGKQEIGYLTVFFWFTSKPSPAYDVFSNSFVQSQFATPLLLLASYFFLKTKYFLSFLLLVPAWYAHLPLALPISVIFAVVFLCTKQFNLFIKYFSFLAVLILPLYAKMLTIVNKVGDYDVTWVELMRIRNSHHLFPFSWDVNQWLPSIVFFLFFLLSYFCVKNKIQKHIRQPLTFFLFIPPFILILATIFSEIIKIPWILTFAPFHIGNIATIFPSIIIVIFLYNLCRSNNFLKAIGFVLSYVFFFNQYSLRVSLSFIILLPMYVLLVIVFKNRLKLLFISLLIISTMWLPYMFYKNQLRIDQEYADWVKVQMWAKNNTSVNALFIVPISIDGFRLYSERSILADWTDGGAGFFAPNYMKKWWERMEDLGLTKTQYDVVYRKYAYNYLSEVSIKNLFRKYNAHYIVVERTTGLSLSEVYKNEHFVVYK